MYKYKNHTLVTFFIYSDLDISLDENSSMMALIWTPVFLLNVYSAI